MSGHSKWHNIKIKKSKTDAVRGRLFTKITKEVSVAARQGGGDIESNPRLRTAVQKAREINMPLENIKKAIQRGTGELPGVTYEEVSYEGYGPGGVAIMVDVMTDNKNRVVSEIRSIFSRNGGHLGETGCVSWVFEKKGLMVVNKEKISEDEIISIALDAGAEDIRIEENSYDIIVGPEDFEKVKNTLIQKNVEPSLADITMLPKNTLRLEEKEAQQILRLMDLLEQHEDIQHVYANFDIPDEVIEKCSS